MEKLKMHSPDLTARNVERIGELFPQVMTELRDEVGNVTLAVDFDLLRQELFEQIIEGPLERYQLDWPGKRAAAFAANAPISKTLRPEREDSVNFDTTKNLFIEGDNLDALKLLQESYLGKVKLIYIDPPYNTGHDFVYADDFAESASDYLERSGQSSSSGERLIANPESNGRFHSDWLSMMYPRLKLARTLLADDGVLFMSIDDNESANLRKITEEIFGRSSFVGQVAVQINPRGRHLDRFIAKTHESLLIFVRNPMSDAISGIAKDGRMTDEYDREDERGPFRLLGLRNRNQAFNPTTRPNLYYPLYIAPATGKVSISRSDGFSVEVLPDAPDGTQTCWTWSKEKVLSEGELLTAEAAGNEWRVFRKDYLHGVDGEVAKTLVKSIWLDSEFSNDYGRTSVKQLFGKAVMDFPKSPALMKRLVEIGCPSGGTVLDFFAGSSSMAHAVMATNASDGGDRRFIMVQLDEATDAKSEAAAAGFSTISELSRERIRRAGIEICDDSGLLGESTDVGFRALRVDTTNKIDVLASAETTSQTELLAVVDSVKGDRSSEDLLFEILIDWGLDLTFPLQRRSVNGQDVIDVDNGALLTCFADEVLDSVVRAIAAEHPLRVVFKDSGFADDAAKINVEQIFRELSPETEIRAI